MSDECRSYVKRFSPFTGSTFWVHYAYADIANAQHGYELFVSDRRLTEEWPFSVRAVERARSELIAAGFLTVIGTSAPGTPQRLKFNLGIAGVEPNTRQHGGRRTPAISSGNTRQSGGERPPTRRVAPITNRKGTEGEQKHPQTPSLALVVPDQFDAFYALYPRHTHRATARRAWDKAIKRVRPEVIMAGAARYAADPNLPPTALIPYPATWLNADAWDDDPCPPDPRRERPADPMRRGGLHAARDRAYAATTDQPKIGRAE
jgi:hypothetical protein